LSFPGPGTNPEPAAQEKNQEKPEWLTVLPGNLFYRQRHLKPNAVDLRNYLIVGAASSRDPNGITHTLLFSAEHAGSVRFFLIQ
jgi:hypothetical protein